MTLSGLFSEAVSCGHRAILLSLFALTGSLPFSSNAACLIEGLSQRTAGTTKTYFVSSRFESVSSYQWAISNNTAQASLIGATNSDSVQVSTATNGAFDLYCVITSGTD